MLALLGFAVKAEWGILGEREWAHLVVQLGRFFCIRIYIIYTTDYAMMLAGSQASQNDRESVVLLKLPNTISVAPSNIQLYMLSSKC